MVKKGLGRGLDALFSIYDDEETEKVEAAVESVLAESPAKTEKAVERKPIQIRPAEPKAEAASSMRIEALPNRNSQDGALEIDIKLIDPNKDQPRKNFNPTSLKELAESIKQHGVIQPIVVNENKGRYMIIAGERRFRASLIAGKRTIPCVVKHYDEKQVKEVSLIENLQREDLNPVEAARAIRQLMDGYGFTQETVADRIGKSRPAIANTLRLLTLCPEVVSLIEDNKLSAGHARCLVVVSDKATQIELANQACDNRMTVRDLEKAVREQMNPNKAAKKSGPKEQSLELKTLIGEMQRLFATKVSALGNDKRGRIYMDYYNRDDLDRIAEIVEQAQKLRSKEDE